MNSEPRDGGEKMTLTKIENRCIIFAFATRESHFRLETTSTQKINRKEYKNDEDK